MRKLFNLAFLGLGLLTGGILSSCSTEMEPDVNSGVGSILVKPTKTAAYTGDHYWTNTRANAGDGYIGNQTWKEYDPQSLTNITDSEREAVLEAIKNKVTGSKISEDLVFPWTAYFLQDVVSGQDGRFDNAGSNGTSSSSYVMEVWNKGAKCDQQYWPGYGYEDYETITNSAHLNNYFQKEENGSQTRIGETSLMYNMTVGTYDEMHGRQFRWYINCHENLHWSEYIIVKVDGSYYICFDFACGYPENQNVDGHPGKGCEVNDWDYNDWILKITPAGNQPEVWGETPEEPEPEDTCDKCGHPSHGDVCEECEPGDDCYKDEVVPEQPEAPEYKASKDHVEVNLTIEDFTENKKQSHLSIHVRSVTNVDVFIPVPSKFLCDADDMAIVQKHEDLLMKHGETMTESSFDINGHEVKLFVELQMSEDGETGGIHVWTEGINEDVISYLEETFNDGITFEVWNYFNETADEWELKEYFDQALVKFLDKLPEAYVNAYNDTDTGEMYDRDCHVGIVEEQKGNYDGPEKDYHYNGSPYNDIYTNKNSVTE